MKSMNNEDTEKLRKYLEELEKEEKTHMENLKNTSTATNHEKFGGSTLGTISVRKRPSNESDKKKLF